MGDFCCRFLLLVMRQQDNDVLTWLTLWWIMATMSPQPSLVEVMIPRTTVGHPTTSIRSVSTNDCHWHIHISKFFMNDGFNCTLSLSSHFLDNFKISWMSFVFILYLYLSSFSTYIYIFRSMWRFIGRLTYSTLTIADGQNTMKYCSTNKNFSASSRCIGHD